jgi:hypothetical protein
MLYNYDSTVTLFAGLLICVVLCRAGGGGRNEPERSPEPAGTTSGDGRQSSPELKAFGMMYKPFTQEKLTADIQIYYSQKYIPYINAIRKFAQELVNVKENANVIGWNCVFSNVFQDETRSIHLIYKYYWYLRDGDDFLKKRLSTVFGRELFVLTEIDGCPAARFKDNDVEVDAWLHFLSYFENNQLDEAKKHFARDVSPAYSPTSPDYNPRTPSLPPSSDDGAGSQATEHTTPPYPTDAAAANATPLQAGRQEGVVDVMEMEMSDAMPDPFPQNEHVGAEVVIYRNSELLNCEDEQFRYYFVDHVK